MMNSSAAPIKKSKMEVATNYNMLVLITILLTLTLIATVIHDVVIHKMTKKHWYLIISNVTFFSFHWSFLTYLISFHLMVPISLSVTIEFIKFFQAYFISCDTKMFDSEKNIYASVKTSSIIEDLGQVNYIFSDKTGTVTKNIMTLKALSIEGNIYGMSGPFWNQIEKDLHTTEVKQFLQHLILCNTVVPENKGDDTDEPRLQSSSPDETALVMAAYKCGYKFISRDQDCMTFSRNGNIETWSILNILEFTSDRKRMSAIVKSPEGKIILLCKGADSVIFSRLDQSCQTCETSTYNHLEDFAKKGLRTLCIAYKEISNEEYEDWSKRYYIASNLLNNKEEELNRVSELIENNLKLIGATAILDELQDKVSSTIKTLLNANIRVWMLTGDKTETAINIGYTTNLLNDDIDLKVLDCSTVEECKNFLTKIIKDKKIVVTKKSNGKRISPLKPQNIGLVIPGNVILINFFIFI